MSKEEINYNKEFKRLNIFSYIMMTMLLIIVLFSLVSACGNKKIRLDYDVSMMREVGVEDILDMFESGKTYVLFVGHDKSEDCLNFLPVLSASQINNNYITQYLDISKVDRDADNWKEVVKLLDIETTANVSQTNELNNITATFGYFLDEYGITPCTIFITNHKQKAGFFGTKKLIVLEDWLMNNGI